MSQKADPNRNAAPKRAARRYEKRHVLAELPSDSDGGAMRIPTKSLAPSMHRWQVGAGILIVAVAAFACSNPFNDPYKDAHKAAVALQAAERQGLTLTDFQRLTQDLATQVQLADEAAGDVSKGSVNSNKALCYSLALLVDQRAVTTWNKFLEPSEVTRVMKDEGELKRQDPAQCGFESDGTAGGGSEKGLEPDIKDFHIPVDSNGCVFLNEALSAIWDSQNRFLRKAASGESP